jgi:ribosome-binding factor A
MSRKFQNRISELVKHNLMTLIERDLNDPRCAGISITDVEVTNDTAHARVYFSIIGDAEARKLAGEGLRSASGWLSRELGQRLRTKNTPKLSFKFDESLERGEHIQQLIDSIKQQEKPLSE